MIDWDKRVFSTQNEHGYNGRLILAWQDDEMQNYTPRQVYVTTLAPGCSKGPHMHLRRDSLFVCVKGAVLIALIGADGKITHVTRSGVGNHCVPVAVHIPAGTACKLTNASHEEAMVLNLSSGHYDPTDEHEVPNA